METTEIYITDKTGKKFWKTLCSTKYLAPERRNLERHLENAKKHPARYQFLDLATARIETVGETLPEINDEDLLAELGL